MANRPRRGGSAAADRYFFVAPVVLEFHRPDRRADATRGAAQGKEQHPEAAPPLLDPDGAEPLLSFQLPLLEDFAEHQSDPTSNDGVSEAGLPWWTLLLLGGRSLAAGSLALQPGRRRRRASLHADPDEPSC